jgi:hypothetical protein
LSARSKPKFFYIQNSGRTISKLEKLRAAFQWEKIFNSGEFFKTRAEIAFYDLAAKEDLLCLEN